MDYTPVKVRQREVPILFTIRIAAGVAKFSVSDRRYGRIMGNVGLQNSQIDTAGFFGRSQQSQGEMLTNADCHTTGQSADDPARFGRQQFGRPH